jgi:hypothetical protein
VKAIMVKDLFLKCSLQMRNFYKEGKAASDCCQAPATTAVRMASGVMSYRCNFHRGMRQIYPHVEMGDVWYTITEEQ